MPGMAERRAGHHGERHGSDRADRPHMRGGGRRDGVRGDGGRASEEKTDSVQKKAGVKGQQQKSRREGPATAGPTASPSLANGMMSSHSSDLILCREPFVKLPLATGFGVPRIALPFLAEATPEAS
jgi:hypothetical protein